MTEGPIGFIGLGNMGSGMVKSLIRGGHQVVAYDLRSQYVDSMAREGATPAISCRDVAERCRIVMSSLPDPRAVEAAVLGEAGTLEAVQRGDVYVDLSTIDPGTSLKAHAALAEKGARMLDCPVGKGPAQAAAGDLALMVGGDADLLEEMRPILQCVGSEIFHCGPAGTGAATKLINNLVSCSVLALTSE
ncbi:MAG: NAD(P)-dependent oxidoreductase, partial [Pseudomonadota bacterium]